VASAILVVVLLLEASRVPVPRKLSQTNIGMTRITSGGTSGLLKVIRVVPHGHRPLRDAFAPRGERREGRRPQEPRQDDRE